MEKQIGIVTFRVTAADRERLQQIRSGSTISDTIRGLIQEESKKKSEAQTLDGSRFAISQR